MVASMPTFAVVGTTPGGVGGRLGSSGLPRALVTISTSRSACTRVAIAHSTSIGLFTSMSSSTITTCFRSITESAARMAFLASPGCFLIEITACQKAQPPSVTLMSFTTTPAVLQRLADRGIARRRREPGVLPRHVQRVVDRVLAVRDRRDPHQRVPVQPAHQPREFAEAPFRPRPAGGKNFPLQHDLGIGDERHVDRLARRERDRLAAQAAGDRHLIHAQAARDSPTP